MKESFLEQVANYILSHYKDKLYNVAVVLPNRRSISKVKKYISEKQNGPFLAPECAYIGDFMLKLSHLQYADYDEQMIYLYQVHTKIAAQYEETAMSFAEFSSKAQAILQDFNDLDMAMAPMETLYKEVYNTKNIDIWDISGENDQNNSRYLQFYERLPLYYQLLNEVLLQQGKAYQGAVYRRVAESTDTIIPTLHYDKVIFVGCQRLSEAESLLLQSMTMAGKADVLVDADKYYVENTRHEAGAGIRKIQEQLPNYSLLFNNEHFKNIPKKIKIYSLPHPISQAKFLPQLLKQIQEEQKDKDLDDAIVVLPDESVMQAVFESMDWEKFPKANVTMGFSLRNTIAYELVDILLQMAIEAENMGNGQEKVWNADTVRALLNHPYIKHLFKEQQEQLCTLQNKFCKVYTQSDLEPLLMDCELLQHAVLYKNDMLLLMQDIRHLLQYIAETQLSSSEYAYAYIVSLNDYMLRIEHLLERVSLNDAASLRLMYESYLSVCTIPFESNREKSGLQIMGMSETKTEDHKTVIVLSVNEGIIPKGRSIKGLVPYNLRAAYKMANDEVYDADTAYYFYRLMQRAENIYLMYVSDAKGESEPSRYLSQLKTELTTYNPQTKIEEYNVVYLQPSFETKNINIQKQEKELAVIKENKHSATSINTYLSCSLQYYLSQVLHLEVNNNDATGMGVYSADMGSAIHEVLKTEAEKYHFAVSYNKQAIKEKILQAYLNLKGKNYQAQDFTSGVNSLLLEVAVEYADKYLKYAKEKYAGAHITIEAEKNIECDLPADDKPIHLKGCIDRVDTDDNGEAYILDYKTGGVNKNDGRLDSLDVDEVFKDKHAKAIQMLLYAYLYHKHHGNPIASVELVPLRDFTHTVPLEVKDRVMDQQFFDDFESSLLSFFENNMCNADTPFAMCVDEDSCKRCNFTPLCLRLQDNE